MQLFFDTGSNNKNLNENSFIFSKNQGGIDNFKLQISSFSYSTNYQSITLFFKPSRLYNNNYKNKKSTNLSIRQIGKKPSHFKWIFMKTKFSRMGC